jgi:hypothetical protein
MLSGGYNRSMTTGSITRIVMFTEKEIDLLREILNEELDMMDNVLGEAGKNQTELPEIMEIDGLLTSLLTKIEHAN